MTPVLSSLDTAQRFGITRDEVAALLRGAPSLAESPAGPVLGSFASSDGDEAVVRGAASLLCRGLATEVDGDLLPTQDVARFAGVLAAVPRWLQMVRVDGRNASVDVIGALGDDLVRLSPKLPALVVIAAGSGDLREWVATAVSRPFVDDGRRGLSLGWVEDPAGSGLRLDQDVDGGWSHAGQPLDDATVQRLVVDITRDGEMGGRTV